MSGIVRNIVRNVASDLSHDILVQLGAKLNGSVEQEVDSFNSLLATKLSDAQINNLNTLVSEVKSALGVSVLLERGDYFRINANETEESSLRNLIKNAHHATPIGSPIWTQFEGHQGDGIGAFLKSGYNPSIDAVNFKQNSASVLVYIRSNSVGVSAALFGTRTDAIAGITGIKSGTSFYWLINSTSAESTSYYDFTGINGFVRDTNNSAKLYLNDSLKDYADTNASTGLPQVEMYELGRNDAGVINSPVNAQQAMIWVGDKLNPVEVQKMALAFEKYMAANSKGVVGTQNITVGSKGTPSVLFTFDDGKESLLTKVKPIFDERNVKFTGYITTDWIDTAGYLTSSQLISLHNDGFDIQGHTKSHTNLTTLTESEVYAELDAVDTFFTGIGLPAPKHMAYPYGGENSDIWSWVATRRQTARDYNNNAIETIPFGNRHKISSISLDGLTTANVDTYKNRVDELFFLSGSNVIVFLTHNVVDGVPGTYESNSDALAELVDYVQDLQIPIKSMSSLWDEINA